MAKFVLAYKGGQMASSETERQAVMAAWGKWFGSLGTAVVDPGNPFGESASVAADRSVKNGAPSALTGYSILTADSLKAALELAKGCPVLRSGGSVEVYETFNVM
ncbi:MAG TPA: hypothetical protein VGZ00_13125 [Candidatus Baltobacteraceae bacterium]|nr:hypothetical protein [Candidatus Baltobacteraceae bacterium]